MFRATDSPNTSRRNSLAMSTFSATPSTRHILAPASSMFATFPPSLAHAHLLRRPPRPALSFCQLSAGEVLQRRRQLAAEPLLVLAVGRRRQWQKDPKGPGHGGVLRWSAAMPHQGAVVPCVALFGSAPTTSSFYVGAVRASCMLPRVVGLVSVHLVCAGCYDKCAHREGQDDAGSGAAWVYCRSLPIRKWCHRRDTLYLIQIYLKYPSDPNIYGECFRAQKEVVWMLMEAKTLCAEMPGPGLSVIGRGIARQKLALMSLFFGNFRLDYDMLSGALRSMHFEFRTDSERRGIHFLKLHTAETQGREKGTETRLGQRK
ncbi:hypothetical protein DFH06DRAFT_1396819 [Mycena polygramma]|nr:hypothetical protein DFH06DRAFT_1396819 [Mycena polygramma]